MKKGKQKKKNYDVNYKFICNHQNKEKMVRVFILFDADEYMSIF